MTTRPGETQRRRYQDNGLTVLEITRELWRTHPPEIFVNFVARVVEGATRSLSEGSDGSSFPPEGCAERGHLTLLRSLWKEELATEWQASCN